jgi:hypothetical protein
MGSTVLRYSAPARHDHIAQTVGSGVETDEIDEEGNVQTKQHPHRVEVRRVRHAGDCQVDVRVLVEDAATGEGAEPPDLTGAELGSEPSSGLTRDTPRVLASPLRRSSAAGRAFTLVLAEPCPLRSVGGCRGPGSHWREAQPAGPLAMTLGRRASSGAFAMKPAAGPS